MPYNLRKRKVVEEISNDSPKRVKKETTKVEPALNLKEDKKVEKKETTVKAKRGPKAKPEPQIEEDKKVEEEPKVEEATTVKKKRATKQKPEPHKEEEKVEEEKVEKIKRTPKAKPEPKKKAKKIEKEPEVEEEPELKEEPKVKEAPKTQKDVKASQESKDNLLVFGSDTCGELGLKKIGCTKKKPTVVELGEPVNQVACGPMHTLVLSKSGSIYSFGCNDEGALGRETDGDETLEATPTIIDLSKNIIKITAGDSHSAALTEDHKVFIWGNFRDEHGSVGLTPESDGQSTCKPQQVLAEKKLVDIASGSNHMLLLDEGGVVYSFGVGAQGQLGRYEPKKANGEGENNEDAITSENREFFLKPQVVSLKNVDPQRPFVCDAIYAGNFSSFATNTDKKKNRLAGWGLNNYYQLAYKGTKGQLVQYYPKRSTFPCATSMISVSCGQHHTVFLTKTGRVYVAGRNEYGMLGLGKDNMKDTKEICPAVRVEGFEGKSIHSISAGINTSFAVSEEGKLYSWGMNGPNLGIDSGDNDLIEPTLVKSLGDYEVKTVATGGSFTAVITKS